MKEKLEKVIDDLIETWHTDCLGTEIDLNDYLGMTIEEYSLFVEKGVIPERLKSYYLLLASNKIKTVK